jgi:hypothetical protein
LNLLNVGSDEALAMEKKACRKGRNQPPILLMQKKYNTNAYILDRVWIKFH